jgi:hypothetical protein
MKRQNAWQYNKINKAEMVLLGAKLLALKLCAKTHFLKNGFFGHK